MTTSARAQTKASAAPLDSSLDPGILRPGIELRLRVGHEIVSGIVDVVMPDQSCFWIWTAGGMGRRMIDTRSAAMAALDS